MSRELPSKQTRITVDLDGDREKFLVGWPGYRNARGRSGLGYVETRAEWARMQGWFLSMLLRKKVITRNPVYLLFLFVIGVLFSLPLILGFPDFINGKNGSIILFVFAPYWIAGLLILRNVFQALFSASEEEDQRESEE